jgi:hypothetical protein
MRSRCQWLVLPWTDGDTDEDQEPWESPENSEEDEEEEEEEEEEEDDDDIEERGTDDGPGFRNQADKRKWLEEACDVWRRKGYRPELYDYTEWLIGDTGGA